ncbi:hypothetical protein CRYUN_Cryun11dG0033600 [Craigia yunnanensis]
MLAMALEVDQVKALDQEVALDMGQEVGVGMALELELDQEMDQADMYPGLGKVLEVREVVMGLGLDLEFDQDKVVVDMCPVKVSDKVQEVLQAVFLVSLYPFHKFQKFRNRTASVCN